MPLTPGAVLGLMSVFWGFRHILAVWLVADSIVWFGVGHALLWLAAGALVLLDRHRSMAAFVVLLLTGLQFWIGGLGSSEGISLVAWLALIIAVTDRLEEQALLTRVLVTVVYWFTALAKMNPSWFAGARIESVLEVRSRFDWLFDFVDFPGVAVGLAIGVVLIELLIPVGLWNPSWRRRALAAGIAMHLSFVLILGGFDFPTLHLLLLNAGLIGCYGAFWMPIGGGVRVATPAQKGPRLG